MTARATAAAKPATTLVVAHDRLHALAGDAAARKRVVVALACVERAVRGLDAHPRCDAAGRVSARAANDAFRDAVRACVGNADLRQFTARAAGRLPKTFRGLLDRAADECAALLAASWRVLTAAHGGDATIPARLRARLEAARGRVLAVVTRCDLAWETVEIADPDAGQAKLFDGGDRG